MFWRKLFENITFASKFQNLLQKFQAHIQQDFSFLKDKKILLAISGGVDSVVLADLFYKSDFNFAFAHCNFRLRGSESDKDEIFVKEIAKKMGIACFVIHFDTKKYAEDNNISIQMAARDLRYNWFEEISIKNKFDYIATAHHADDNLETFLINLTRGTGLDGLTGIPNINNNIVRPLLPFSRNEIENYAKINNLNWREDSSNSEIKYLRNKLRHDVIPTLKELNPALLSSFSQTIDHLKGARQIIDDRIEDIQKDIVENKEEIIRFDIQKLKKLKNLRAYLFELLKNYGFTEWNDITDLISSQSGKQVFSKTHRLLKDRDFLILSRGKEEAIRLYNNEIENNQELKIKTEEIKKKDLGDFKNSDKNNIYVDKDLLKLPLHVRRWKNGDYFYPIGMKGRKKLSKYFKDEKLSLIEKENIWLLCSNNDIIWVVGKRADERFKITDKTKKILKIEIEK